jgi:hypothetical protein
MELIVTLGLAAVVIGIGASARTEAMKRQMPVALCPSDNPDGPVAPSRAESRSSTRTGMPLRCPRSAKPGLLRPSRAST